ncbi:MAG TPA: hypothetical protein VMW24_21400 [Sedimentisphaerales bacterium]|nr:hypothetical protein [Sedimentisphaerales bacterium]
MAVIPFGEYLPDLPDVQNKGLTIARNAVPRGVGFKPFNRPLIVSDMLDARARYLGSFEDSSGVHFTYAGDATKLYILAANTWSGAGTYNLTEEDNWEGVRWDNNIILTNINDEPVEAAVGSGSFATFMTSTLKPKAHHIAVVSDCLVLGDINDGAINRNGIIWSALGDYTDFDESSSTLAGAQDLQGSHGAVNKIIGGRTGIIFQEDAIWRMTFEGPPTKFRFDRIADNVGSISKNGVIKSGTKIFFLAEDGFRLLDEPSGQLSEIGKNRLDNTVLSEIDKNSLHRVSTAINEFGIIFFAYPTSGGNPDRIAIYNPFRDRWGTAEIENEILGLYRGGAQDIDSAPLASRDIDADPYLIDSAEFKGGEPVLAVFDPSHRLATLEGIALDAVFETGEGAFEGGRRNYVNRQRPIIEGTGTTTVAIGTRELLSETSSFGSTASLNGEGEATLRGSGRYMKFRTTVTGGFDNAIGIEVEPKAKGRK